MLDSFNEETLDGELKELQINNKMKVQLGKLIADLLALKRKRRKDN